MKKKVTVKGLWNVLKASFGGFGEYKVPKLSASLAYYTVFSMGPLLIVIISLCGIFLGREAVEGTIYDQMNSFVGPDAAKQVQDIIKNASLGDKDTVAMIIGIVTLLIGATTVFAEIQDSINTIWGLKPKPKAGLMKLLSSRFLSFGVIVSLGFLLLVSLAATTVVESLGKRLQDRFPDITVVVFYIINLLLTLSVVTLLFAVIFKVLPDAKIGWKDVWPGSIFTAILFVIGKFLISLYIAKSNVGGTYGTAGSLVILILWIYYSSIILYFGAVFTKQFALEYAHQIRPNKFAVIMNTIEVEAGNQSVQQGEANKEKVKGKLEQEMAPNAPSNRLQPQPALVAGVKVPKPKPAKKKGPGMMTVLGGILLFYFNTANKKIKN
jgi:membrane protein